MRASELQDLLVTSLARDVGGNRRRWRIAIGPVKLHPVQTHPHCNWSVSPTGGSREIAEIEKLLDDIRIVHPVIDEG